MGADCNKFFSQSPSAVYTTLSSGIALLETETNTYFTLNAVGQFIWSQLKEPRLAQELAESVVEEFDVELIKARMDIDQLLNDLDRAGLVKMSTPY